MRAEILIMRLAPALLLFTTGGNSYAQDFPQRDINAERVADDLFPQQNLDINYQEYYENFLQQIAEPLDINSATAEQLRALYLLSEQQITAVLKYRNENGLFLSVYELQAVPNLDLPLLYKLMPFVKVRDVTTTIDKSLVHRVLQEKNNFFIARYERTLEAQQGYKADKASATRYAGDPGAVYLRARVSRPGDFSVGITAEKDSGEALSFSPSHHTYGMDYISFHTQLSHKGWLQNLIAGDYLAQFGQGLVLGGGFGMGKGAETITTLRRTNLGFIPYTSAGESGFFRGVASSIELSKELTVHSFLSGVRRDAVENQDSTNEYSFVSSFAATGYHRTANEISSRKQIRESNYGIVLNYKKSALEIGMICHSTNFSLPLTRKPTLYNQFSFNGDHLTDISAYANYSLHNFTFFSEVAQTLGHGKGFVGGILGSISRKLDVSLLYRHYDRNYYTLYSNAIAENTLPQNESGMYWGWKYVLSKKYSWSGYADLFRFPWLRYRDYAPSDGSEWLIRFNYQPSKTTSFFFQLRSESKERNLDNESNVYETGPGRKQSLWLNCDYGAGLHLKFKTRAQFSKYTIGGSTGLGNVLLQDVSVDVGRFSIAARYALFHTDDYDNRLYLYERDAWLAFSFPAYFGTGVHSYVLLQVKISKVMDVWMRWSGTRYTDRSVIGSAGELINGNVKNDVKLQVRLKLI